MAVTGYKLSKYTGDYPNITLVEEYFSRIVHQAQQTEMKLEGQVTPYPLPVGTKTLWVPMDLKIDGTTGRKDTMNANNSQVDDPMATVGADIQEVTARYEFTQNQILETKKRQLQSTRWEFSPLIERVDMESRFANINDTINFNTMARWNRYKDSVIITALGASVIEGSDDTSTGAFNSNTVSFPNSQIIDSTGNDPMSRDKLEDVIELFNNNDISLLDEKPILLVGPKQVRNLRDEDVLINYDYVSNRPLEGNQLPSALGFKVIWSNLLSVTDNIRTCYAFLPSAIIHAEWEDMYTSVAVRSDRRDAIQTRFEHESGALRIDDYKVVKIMCNEAAGI